jgi:predicted nucleic acid-binding protein
MIFVVDASVAIKWVVDEAGTIEAVALRQKAKLIAPELLIPECANILWKKVQRKDLSKDVARIAARLLKGAELELLPMRALLEEATLLAIDLGHPAYDCLYLALAIANDCSFVTADERLARKLAQSNFREKVMTLAEATNA